VAAESITNERTAAALILNTLGKLNERWQTDVIKLSSRFSSVAETPKDRPRPHIQHARAI
jgi:hypothetical protein